MEWFFGILVALLAFFLGAGIHALSDKIQSRFLGAIAGIVGVILPIPAYIAIGLFCEMPKSGLMLEVKNKQVVSFDKQIVVGWNADAYAYPMGIRQLELKTSWQAENLIHNLPFTVYYQNIPTLEAHQRYYDFLLAKDLKENAELPKYFLATEEMVKQAQQYASQASTDEMLYLTSTLRQYLYKKFVVFGLEIIGITIEPLETLATVQSVPPLPAEKLK